MEKQCTNCKKDKELSFFDKSKAGKYGFTSNCKECIKEKNKAYRRTPEYKIKHAANERIRRALNPEKIKETNYKSWFKNKDKYNEKRVHLYATDIEFREKKQNQDKNYRQSGKRLLNLSKPENREKARISTKKYRDNNPDYSKESNKKYRLKNHLSIIQKERIERETLHENYVKKVIRKRFNYPIKEIPKEILESCILTIKLKRCQKELSNLK
jgi:hypothetical protein